MIGRDGKRGKRWIDRCEGFWGKIIKFGKFLDLELDSVEIFSSIIFNSLVIKICYFLIFVFL